MRQNLHFARLKRYKHANKPKNKYTFIYGFLKLCKHSHQTSNIMIMEQSVCIRIVTEQFNIFPILIDSPTKSSARGPYIKIEKY